MDPGYSRNVLLLLNALTSKEAEMVNKCHSRWRLIFLPSFNFEVSWAIPPEPLSI